jgi:hypothetical protein
MTSTWAVLRQGERLFNLCGRTPELTRFLPFRLFSIVAALLWWMAATGHTQESGTGCSTQVIGGGCEAAPNSSPDGNEALVSTAPSRPIVTYTNGKLTVTALNTSLADVLRAVSAQTGTIIDFPAGSAAERIVVREGPGSIRHVLANLLNGSGFNYVIVASPNAPDVLERVVLAKADQRANASPQPADESSSTSEQPKDSSSPLWTPPSGSSLWTAPTDSSPWTPPMESSLWTPPKAAPSAPVSPPALDEGSLEPPPEDVSPDVLDQTLKDKAQQQVPPQ